jgi:signal transduction histidine kinase
MVKCLFILLILVNFSFSQIKNAQLDLKSSFLTSNYQKELSGEWKFYWKELLTNPDSNKPSHLIHFSTLWNDLSYLNSDINNIGYATYYLAISSEFDSEELAFDVPGFYSSYKLLLNGEEISSNGTVAKTKEEAIPFWLPKVVPIVIKKGVNHLVLQVSSYRHYKGGTTQTIRIGKDRSLLSEQKFQIAIDIFLFGILIITGLFIFGFYIFGQKEKYLVYFAMFCFAYSYRQIGFGDCYLHALMPFLPWQLLLTVEYISLGLCVFSFSSYVVHLFPEEANKLFLKSIRYLSLAFISLVIFLPTLYFTHLLSSFLVIVFSYMMYIIYVFFRAYLNQRLGAKYALISVVFVFSGFILLMIEHLFYAKINTFLVFLSILGFLFFQVMILSYSFAMFYKKALLDANSGLRAKSIFLASISHEIRTPLSSILGASEILEKTELAENQNAFVNIIKRSSLNLNVIISDILNLTKLEYSQVNFNDENINIVKLIEEVLQVQYTNQNFNKDNVEFSYQIDPDLPLYFVSDSTRLKQILNNLFYNALKFTKKGSISILCELKEISNDSMLIHFQIKDTGIGIPKDKLNSLFEQFSQVDSSNKHGHGGIGLGLYICKILVSKFNGEIWVESEKDKGSSFHFTVIVKKSTEEELVGQRFTINEPLKLYLTRFSTETDEMFHNFSNTMKIPNIEFIDDNEDLTRLIKADPKAILICKDDIFEHITKVDLLHLDYLKVIIVVNHYEDLDKDIELIESVTTLPKPIKLSLIHKRIEAFQLTAQ